MIEKKYLIIIAVVICLIIVYYFCHETSNIKKSLLTNYQKTMVLEAKIQELENKKPKTIAPKCITKNNHSPMPIFSVSYDSDMIRNGNLSVGYTDLSGDEAQEILKNINKHKQQQQTQLQQQQEQQIPQPQPNALPCIKPSVRISPKISPNKVDFFDFDTSSNVPCNNLYSDNTLSDTFNVKFSDLTNNQLLLDDFDDIDNTKEYLEILHDLDTGDEELDHNIIKNISESIQLADKISDDSLSSVSAEKKIVKKNYNKGKRVNKKVGSSRQNNR